jgi:pyruvate/2-oxoglutarate dehydrogenase complex dihydrolipoamide dehydrogenase (E3) component
MVAGEAGLSRIETDLCVIGAGAGGLSVAAGAVQMGVRVVLVEGHLMGGDCLNFGCVPAKALIAAARRADAVRRGGFGVAAREPEVDFAAVKDHLAEVIAAIAPMDSVERFTGLGCVVIRDWGRFVSRRELAAGGVTVRARRFVIATGSRPALPPIPGIGEVEVLTNETVFSLRERPEHLLVLGGGPMGLELAQAHRRLGCRVSVVEAGRAMGREDAEAVARLLALLQEEGIELHEGVRVEQVTRVGGRVVLQSDRGEISGSHLLVTAGRVPNLERLDLARAGVACDARGVRVDARLRSVSNRAVFALGDAAGGGFTHVAGYHAGVVVRQAVLGLPARLRSGHLPRVTFTDPELAQVGLTEAEARARFGRRVEVVTAEFAGVDRAVAEAQTQGLAKVMVVRGRPVGATILGPQAGELIAVWAMAMANRMGMVAIAATVFPYPTLGDVNKRITSAYLGPRLFRSATVKRVARLVQRWLP